MAKIIGIHTPAEIKNFIINGNFDFWQRTTSTTVNTAATNNFVTADRAKTFSGGPAVKNYTIARATDVPTFSQSGNQSLYNFQFTMNTGVASLAAGDITIPFYYNIEGSDYQKLHGKTISVGFWVNASVPGTYSFAIKNGAQNRTYLTTFTVIGASTWEFKSITIGLDTAGTWAFDNTVGLEIDIGTVCGTTYQTSTLNAWQAGNFYMASNATNWQATTGATFKLSQFSLTEGTLSPGPTGFQRAGKSIMEELAMCQRYCFATTSFPITMGEYVGGSSGSGTAYLPVTMRSNPTIVNPSIADLNNNSASTYNSSSFTRPNVLFVIVNNVSNPQNTYGSIFFSGILDAEL